MYLFLLSLLPLTLILVWYVIIQFVQVKSGLGNDHRFEKSGSWLRDISTYTIEASIVFM